MKKHILKRTSCFALSLMLSTATMTTMNAYAATNQYAYAKIYGSSSNTVTDSKAASSSPFNTTFTNIPAVGLQNTVEAKPEKVTKVINSVINAIKKLDASFNLADYRMTVNMFAPQDGNGMITFTYYMDDLIKTSKGFVAVIENNVVVEVFANNVATQEENGELNLENVSEIELISLAKEHMTEKSSSEISNTVKVIKTTKQYYYDYITGKLTFEKAVFYSLPEADGAIADYTVETVLN